MNRHATLNTSTVSSPPSSLVERLLLRRQRTSALDESVPRAIFPWPDKWALGYALLLIVIIVIGVRYPTGNYDGVFYTALTLPTTDFRTLQRAGLEFDRHVPNPGKSDYREDMARNPAHFVEQLPYYSVKPLYVCALRLARMMGFGWRSGALISGSSFGILGWLIWAWLRKYFNSLETLVFASLLMFNPTLVRLIRWTSPDVIAILTVMAGVYLIAESSRTVSGIGLLLVAVWIRPETLIFLGLVVCAAYFHKKVSLIEAGILSILALGSYAFITTLGGFSQSTLFYNTFIERTNNPAEGDFVITRAAYFHVVVHSVQQIFFANPIVILPLLILAIDYFLLNGRDTYSALLVSCLLASVILFGIHPQMDARYYCYQWALIPALLLLVHTKVRIAKRNCS